ncbi:MAG: pantoate--beta-alanine ligase [Actinomycetota bacterium]|nr:pantoate--beta-alanine ligase [Actinomycetota bacterium]
MRFISQTAEVHEYLDQARAQNKSVGLVPTMGYLHGGHVSLIQRSVEENDITMVTIFVNPLQFGKGEDLSSYPRDLQSDRDQCEAEEVDLLFAPSLEEMYSKPVLTAVHVDNLTATLEGRSRPTHFSGVATVVAKLFNITGPCNAYFGEKDWQQLQVITTMARDLSFRVNVIGCPTIRHSDGLALSSRNAYLTREERQSASVLSRSLHKASELFQSGETRSSIVKARITEEIATEPLVELDYVEVVEGKSLDPVTEIGSGTRILLAAKLGQARLIDNIDPHFGIS